MGRRVTTERHLPGQFGRLITETSAKRLVAAVIMQAVLDYRDSASIAIREDARIYILDDSIEDPFSFINLCGVLNMEPDAIREGLGLGARRLGSAS